MSSRLRPLLLFLTALLACAQAAPAPRGSVDVAQASQLIIEHSNAFRHSQGASPVTPNATLARAAAQFAEFMARSDRYGHEADGRAPVQRAQAQGYDHCLVSENIAFQYSSAGFRTADLARRFVEGWIDSPGHRRNLLDSDATETGVAIVQSPRSGRYYAVQMFGRPRSLQIVFSIANRSGTPLRYRFGDETVALAPRVTQTHEVCRREALTMQLPGQEKPVRIEPAHGERYVVEGGGSRYRIGKVTATR